MQVLLPLIRIWFQLPYWTSVIVASLLFVHSPYRSSVIVAPLLFVSVPSPPFSLYVSLCSSSQNLFLMCSFFSYKWLLRWEGFSISFFMYNALVFYLVLSSYAYRSYAFFTCFLWFSLTGSNGKNITFLFCITVTPVYFVKILKTGWILVM